MCTFHEQKQPIFVMWAGLKNVLFIEQGSSPVMIVWASMALLKALFVWGIFFLINIHISFFKSVCHRMQEKHITQEKIILIRSMREGDCLDGARADHWLLQGIQTLLWYTVALHLLKSQKLVSESQNCVYAVQEIP